MTASLLAPAKLTFVDANGAPLVGGTVQFYVPSTTTPKDTWQDPGQVTLNTNPITLDARGQAIIWGSGAYRQVVKDVNGVTIWDQVTQVDNLATGYVLTFAAIGTTSFAASTTLIQTSGYTTTGVGAATYAPTASTGATAYRIQSLDGQWWQLAVPVIYPEMLGAVGDGVADDTTAMNALWTLLPGAMVRMSGTYKTTSRPSVAFQNCTITGIPGKTKITGAFGYELIQATAMQNAVIDGVIFETTYTNAVAGGLGVFYTNVGVSVSNAVVRRCQFTAPNANVAAVAFYADTGTPGQNGTVDGLWVEDCIFHDVGGSGLTFQNRSGTNSHAKRIYCNRNQFSNIGSIGVSNIGTIIFDGNGQAFTCNDNVIEKGGGIGIQNSAWSDGAFLRNRFRDFSRAYAPMGFSTGPSSRLTIADNTCEEGATAIPFFGGVVDSRFRGNYWWTTGALAMAYKNVNRCRFDGDTYICASATAMDMSDTGGASADNIFTNCTFDTSAGAGSGLISFDGSTTTRNVVRNSLMKLASGTFGAQTASAAGNVIESFSTGSVLRGNGFGAFAMADANTTISGDPSVVSYDVLNITGVLTAGRNLTLAVATFAESGKVLINNTGQTLTLVGPGGSGSTIATATAKSVYYRTDTQLFQVI